MKLEMSEVFVFLNDFKKEILDRLEKVESHMKENSGSLNDLKDMTVGLHHRIEVEGNLRTNRIDRNENRIQVIESKI